MRTCARRSFKVCEKSGLTASSFSRRTRSCRSRSDETRKQSTAQGFIRWLSVSRETLGCWSQITHWMRCVVYAMLAGWIPVLASPVGVATATHRSWCALTRVCCVPPYLACCLRQGSRLLCETRGARFCPFRTRQHNVHCNGRRTYRGTTVLKLRNSQAGECPLQVAATRCCVRVCQCVAFLWMYATHCRFSAAAC